MTPEQIVRTLCQRRQTLATAESLTGGLVAARIVAVSGASGCFEGGLVAYQDKVKADVLGIGESILEKHSAVSAACARDMAQKARLKFQSDYALSTTGYAGPTGENVGSIYIGVATPQVTKVYHVQLAGSRNALRETTTKLALQLLGRML